MLRPDCKIEFTQQNGRSEVITFDGVNDMSIRSTFKNMTDTCEIVFAHKYTWKGQNVFSTSNPLLKVGDKVKIQIGYNNTLETAFSGYITALNTEEKTVIKCEDELWILKRKLVKNKEYTKVSLKTLLEYTIGSVVPYKATLEYEDLGRFSIINNPTIAQVLEKLRTAYELEVFMREGVLYVGRKYLYDFADTKTKSKEHTFEFQETIINSNLEWQTNDKSRYYAKVIGLRREGNKKKRREVIVGDTTGAQITRHYYGDYSEDQLKTMGTEYLSKMVYDGYRGGFKAFGEPFVLHGDRINLIDKRQPERDGTYFVKGIEYEFGWNGYFQNIELGNRLL